MLILKPWVLSYDHNLAIFWALAHLKPEHVQNPMKLWSAIFITLRRSEQFLRALFDHIQTYSELCATLAYTEIWHIRNSEFSESFPNCIPTHSQNPAIHAKIGEPVKLKNLSMLTIRKCLELLHIYKNRSTLYNFGNLEIWHIDISTIFRTLKYLKPDIDI